MSFQLVVVSLVIDEVVNARDDPPYAWIVTAPRFVRPPVLLGPYPVREMGRIQQLVWLGQAFGPMLVQDVSLGILLCVWESFPSGSHLMEVEPILWRLVRIEYLSSSLASHFWSGQCWTHIWQILLALVSLPGGYQRYLTISKVALTQDKKM